MYRSGYTGVITPTRQPIESEIFKLTVSSCSSEKQPQNLYFDQSKNTLVCFKKFPFRTGLRFFWIHNYYLVFSLF